ncbi:MAG: SDR family NAD(P)-dependent oxidoreductase, partial [Rhodanobacter sp.]
MNQTAFPKRVALVTGGIGGLGTEICRHLATAGSLVIATDLAARDERVATFRGEVAGFDGAILFEPVDVSDFDSCRQLIERVEQRHGCVDILVNAAGITRDASLRKMSPQQWHELMQVNLDGVFNMCRNVIEGMT